VLEFLAKQSFFSSLPKPPFQNGVLPTAVSLAASFTVLFAVTWWTSRDQEPDIDEDVELVMEL